LILKPGKRPDKLFQHPANLPVVPVVEIGDRHDIALKSGIFSVVALAQADRYAAPGQERI
jgi:hypothetical protein